MGEVGGRSSISSLPRLSARWPLRVRGRAHVSGDYPRDGGATRLSQTQGGDTQPTAVHIVAHMCSPWLQHTQQIWHHGNATVRAQLWALDAASGHAAVVAWLPPLTSDDASGGAAATVAAVEKATGRILVVGSRERRGSRRRGCTRRRRDHRQTDRRRRSGAAAGHAAAGGAAGGGAARSGGALIPEAPST